MARRFRLYNKKRGNRRTGSKRLGGYGEVLFFAVLLVIGGVGFYLLLTEMILPEWQANRHFVAGECEILDKRVGEIIIDGDHLYRPEILIAFEVDGKSYREYTYRINQGYGPNRNECQEIIDRFTIGSRIPCWYDPNAPRSVVLERGYSWWFWLLLILPSSIMILGAVGSVVALLQSGTSAERRAALAHKAANLDLFEDAAERGVHYPSIPRITTITDSPGTRLAYRLPIEATAGWVLVGMLLVNLLWNGILAWFVVDTVRDFLNGQGQWAMIVWLLPLAAAGGALIYISLRKLLQATRAGSTRVEISSHPLYPGESYDVFLSQSGHLTINALEVLLVCDEVASYRQGTDIRTERMRVYESPVYSRRELRIEPGLPFEDACRITLPEEAMHSFQASHNEIQWKLVVRGDVPRRPSFERQFSMVVHPLKN